MDEEEDDALAEHGDRMLVAEVLLAGLVDVLVEDGVARGDLMARLLATDGGQKLQRWRPELLPRFRRLVEDRGKA